MSKEYVYCTLCLTLIFDRRKGLLNKVDNNATPAIPPNSGDQY